VSIWVLRKWFQIKAPAATLQKKSTSTKNKQPQLAWFSLRRRASRDLLAATLFLTRFSQYFSSFDPDGT